MDDYIKHIKEYIIMYEGINLLRQYRLISEDVFNDVNEKLLDMMIEYLREVNQL